MPDRTAAMTAAEQWITDRRRGWEARLDRLGDLLQGESPPRRNHDPVHRCP